MSLSLEDYRAARKARAADDSDIVAVRLSTGWATVDEDGVVRASLVPHGPVLGDLDDGPPAD